LETDDYLPATLLQLVYATDAGAFAAALGFVFLLLCLATVVAAARSALLRLTQDELGRVEDGDTPRDRCVLYLSDRQRLLKAACSGLFSVIIIAVTALLFLAASCIDAPLGVASASTFVAAVALWSLFYAIAPKLFLGDRLRTARALSPLLKLVVKLFSPFVRLTDVPVDDGETIERHKNQVPLDGEAPGDMYEEKEMLDEIIHFYDKKATEIMTPRTDVVAIDRKSSLDEVMSVIVETGYSRLPVFDDTEDNIRGVLYVKDLIPELRDSDGFEWQTLIRKPFYVPESKKIYALLNELRANRTHIAIVVDEFGCTSGIVTMEDIIEEIIGDISDEYDDDNEHSFMALRDGSYIFEGKTQLNDFFRETGVSPSDFSEYTDEAETLTGLMLAIKGALPRRGEVIDCKDYRFRILEADQRRILKVKFGTLPATAPTSDK
jgi:CBS domain containing-hemolysin-like protein